MPLEPTSPIRLAVLPLENLSGDPGQDYFCRGFADDLVVDLSCFPHLELIAPYSAFAVADLEPKEIGAKLNAAYLLVGTLMARGKALRLTAKLVQTAVGAVVWADRFEAVEAEVFELQDTVVERVAGALPKSIETATLKVARRKPVTELAAYDCWLRGFDQLRDATPDGDEAAREYFERALELDPSYARAHVGMSLSYFNEWGCQLWELADISQNEAFEHAGRALRLDDSDAIVHMVQGRVHLYRREFAKAEQHLNRSVELNPKDAENIIQVATCKAYLGKADEGVQLFERALELNPIPDPCYFAFGGFAYYVHGDCERAVENINRTPDATATWLDIPAHLAAAYIELGDKEAATKSAALFREVFIEKITRGREPEPGEPMGWLKNVNPFQNEEDWARFEKGLLAAGMEPIQAEISAYACNNIEEPAEEQQNLFQEAHCVRRIQFDGRFHRLREVKGFKDIATLLARPEEEIHCSELMGTAAMADDGAEALDEKTRLDCETRIRELREELAEHERNNNEGRAAPLREEMDKLLDYLKRATGLGGRGRKLGAPSEKARSAVTWRIRSAIKKIDEVDPGFAKHLSNAVRTGVFCSYSPEQPVVWEV